MKRIILPLAIFAMVSACNNAPKADDAATGDKQQASQADGTIYTIDSTTKITWTGTKINGSHTGTFNVKDGSLSVKDGNLNAGSFTIDIASLNNTDLTADDGKAKLEGHLKSADFFDVGNHPVAKFEITNIDAFKLDSTKNNEVVMKDATHTIKGNLTLKDSTKNISFPAKVVIEGDKITAMADFNIDRTQWGMAYKGPNNPQDWVIRKEVNLKLNISATKK